MMPLRAHALTRPALALQSLETLRDVVLADVRFPHAETRGSLAPFGARGTEQARLAQKPLFRAEKAAKTLGRHLVALVAGELSAMKQRRDARRILGELTR